LAGSRGLPNLIFRSFPPLANAGGFSLNPLDFCPELR
jgi:hypothetical protein